MTTKASSPASTLTSIKKEVQPTDEIKDFAETAMNELLGWYGYDSVDRIDFTVKPSKHMAASNVSSTDCKSDINGNSTTPEHDSSREDSKSPTSAKNFDKSDTLCGWCRRLLPQNSLDFLATPDGPRYCSESCFAQSRRASFKRAKTCDWCRHVRHAVSYVDFQDGASQLQFCSDKCLNQYKMQIFCKETQAHLDMNPHLKEKGSMGGGLITPELWLKNCRSRSASPASDVSTRSPTPTKSQTVTHRPLISVAPASKLMSKTTLSSTRFSPKHSRKKRATRYNASTNENNNFTLNSTNKENSSTTKLISNNVSTTKPPKSHTAVTFTNVQDLRLNMPPISPAETPQTIRTNISSAFFQPQPNIHPIRPLLMGPHPRLMGMPPPSSSSHPVPPSPLAEMPNLPIIGGPPPPVTVMVPYPVILPFPIPVPIPLPITNFLKAYTNHKTQPSPDSEPAISEENKNADETTEDDTNEPLDFTKSKEPIDETRTDKIETDKTSPKENKQDKEDDLNQTEEKLPKLKVTRVHSKRLITKESENSRPLRKRKRIIDCDYVRLPKEDDKD